MMSLEVVDQDDKLAMGVLYEVEEGGTNMHNNEMPLNLLVASSVQMELYRP